MVARLTLLGLLGRRRAAVLVILPVLLLALAVTFRAVAGADEQTAVHLLGGLAIGTVLPLMCVIVGTGAIGPEIEDGSIVYLLAKPLSRASIVLSKLAVAVGTAWVFAVLPILVSGLILTGRASSLALGYAVTAAVAAVAYCAVFLLLAVVTKNAVIIGLLYALIWETTVAGFVPGARALSVRQWGLSIARAILGRDADRLDVTSSVGLTTGVVLLTVLSAAATWYAGQRLRTLRLSADE